MLRWEVQAERRSRTGNELSVYPLCLLSHSPQSGPNRPPSVTASQQGTKQSLSQGCLRSHGQTFPWRLISNQHIVSLELPTLREVWQNTPETKETSDMVSQVFCANLPWCVSSWADCFVFPATVINRNVGRPSSIPGQVQN